MCADVRITSAESIFLLATFVQSDTYAGASPAGWFRCLRIVFAMVDYDTKEHKHIAQVLDNMHFILLHATELRELIFEAQFWITDTTLTIIRQSCSKTIMRLDLFFEFASMGRPQACLVRIGAFQNLQELAISSSTPTDIAPDDKLLAWQLPNLTHFSWDQFPLAERLDMFDLTTKIPPTIMAFLARCSFPKLRDVKLMVATAQGLGSTHLQTFLSNHTLLERINVLLMPEQFTAVVPHMKAQALDLTSFQTIPGELVDLFPPQVTAIVIGANTLHVNDITATMDSLFDRLQTKSTYIKQVHLRRIGIYYGVRPFEWGCSGYPMFTGVVTSRAFLLQSRGIVVLDSKGRSLNDEPHELAKR
jgi:hypothetical protein